MRVKRDVHIQPVAELSARLLRQPPLAAAAASPFCQLASTAAQSDGEVAAERASVLIRRELELHAPAVRQLVRGLELLHTIGGLTFMSGQSHWNLD